MELTNIMIICWLNSSGPTIDGDMVSRRRILSRSRDDLHLDNFPEEEDDVWHMKEKLYKVSQHLQQYQHQHRQQNFQKLEKKKKKKKKKTWKGNQADDANAIATVI